MYIKDLISKTIVPLNPSDPAGHALALMDKYRVSHLPIVDKNIFLGLISEADVSTPINDDDPVVKYTTGAGIAYINENQHIYDAITLFSSLSLTLLPVVAENHQYIGSILAQDLVRQMADLFSLRNPGGVIVLEMNEKDFFLTEIANIVESNDAKVLSMTTGNYPDSTRFEVTMKLNRMDITPVLQTFRRYNYVIQTSFSENLNMDTLKERFDSLMKYLNI